MRPAEWQVYVETYQKKQARARAWEARLHGLRHKNGRALTEDDFLPDSLKCVDPRNAEAVFTAFQRAIQTAHSAHAHAAAKQRGPLLTPI